MRGLLSCIVLCAFISGVTLADEKRFELPARPDNAAIDYLLAWGLLSRPGSADEFEDYEVVDFLMQSVPPEAILDYPGAVDVLQQDGEAILALHEAAAKTKCIFDIDWTEGPGAHLGHLRLLRLLAYRCVKVAKYYEASGQASRAAQVYADLLKMGYHVAQTPETLHGLIATMIHGQAVGAIESMLTRDSEPEIGQKLLDALESIPERPYPLGAYIYSDTELCSNWLLREAEKDWDNMLNEFVGWSEYPEMSKLVDGLTVEAALGLLKQWVQEYNEIVEAFGNAAALPYYESVPSYKAACERAEEVLARKETNPKRRNPLCEATLAPLVDSMLRNKVTNSEARLLMLRVACAAVLYKVDKGAFPTELDALAPYLKKGLPKDPFTGKNFKYELRDGLPRIGCTLPKDLKEWSSDRIRTDSIDLSARLEEDAAASEEFKKQVERLRQRRSEDTPSPRGRRSRSRPDKEEE